MLQAIYLGTAASALWVASRTGGPARPPSNASAIVCVLLMLPLLVDGWGQALGLWQAGASVRFATGWAMGISLPPLCIPLLEPVRKPSLRPRSGTDRSLSPRAAGERGRVRGFSDRLLVSNDNATYRRSIGGGVEWLVLASGGIFAWSLLQIQTEVMAIFLRIVVNFGQIFLLIVIVGAVVVPLLRRTSSNHVRQNVGRHH